MNGEDQALFDDLGPDDDTLPTDGDVWALIEAEYGTPVPPPDEHHSIELAERDEAAIHEKAWDTRGRGHKDEIPKISPRKTAEKGKNIRYVERDAPEDVVQAVVGTDMKDLVESLVQDADDETFTASVESPDDESGDSAYKQYESYVDAQRIEHQSNARDEYRHELRGTEDEIHKIWEEMKADEVNPYGDVSGHPMLPGLLPEGVQTGGLHPVRFSDLIKDLDVSATLNADERALVRERLHGTAGPARLGEYEFQHLFRQYYNPDDADREIDSFEDWIATHRQSRAESEVRVRYSSNKGSLITRIFKRDGNDLTVDHAFFEAGEKDTGLAKAVLRSSFALYERVGVDRVTVHANIEVGGYAWALFGYLPNHPETVNDSIKNLIDRSRSITQKEKDLLKHRLSDGDARTAIWRVADTKIGSGDTVRELGKIVLADEAFHWHGTLDLHDAEQMKRLNRYVSAPDKPKKSVARAVDMKHMADGPPSDPPDEQGSELFQTVNGKRVDADLWAELLGDDDQPWDYDATDDLGKDLSDTFDLKERNEEEIHKRAWDTRGRGRKETDRPKVIKVSNIHEAIDLILAGHVVELPEVRKVNTLLNKLAKIARDAEKRGEAAPNYDLCQVTVKGTNLFCASRVRTKENPRGIPRLAMPQFSGEPVPGSPAAKLPKSKRGAVDAGPEFLDHLQNAGIKFSSDVVPAAKLKASQAQLVGPKIADMLRRDVAPRTIFISRDNYILDGHHNWAVAVAKDAENNALGDIKMRVIRIDAPISELLLRAQKWTKKFGIKSRPGGQTKIYGSESFDFTERDEAAIHEKAWATRGRKADTPDAAAVRARVVQEATARGLTPQQDQSQQDAHYRRLGKFIDDLISQYGAGWLDALAKIADKPTAHALRTNPLIAVLFDLAERDEEAIHKKAWDTRGRGAARIESVPDSEWQSFRSTDSSDDYYYHVTLAPQADKILSQQEIRPGSGLMGRTSPASQHGKVFITDRPGVSFWAERAEQHAFDKYDNPPAVKVVRIPKSAVANAQVDDLGSKDARANAFLVHGTIKLSERDEEAIHKKAWDTRGRNAVASHQPLWMNQLLANLPPGSSIVPARNAVATYMHKPAVAAITKDADLMAALGHAGIKVQLTDGSVADVRPELKGKQPRGWPPGYTWDMVAGVYNVGEKAIIAGNVHLSGSSGGSVLAHETGHALYGILLDTSPMAYRVVGELRTAWKQALSDDQNKQISPYFRQEAAGSRGPAGMDEMWAESYSLMAHHGLDSVRKLFGDPWTKVFAKNIESIREAGRNWDM